jgi:hypothetical protein
MVVVTMYESHYSITIQLCCGGDVIKGYSYGRELIYTYVLHFSDDIYKLLTIVNNA